MAQTPQQAAVDAANELISLAQQARTLSDNTDAFLKRNTSEAYGAIWGAMQTAAVNSDGSIGTVDSNPVTTHPIVGPALSPINRSSNTLALGLQFLTDYQTFVAANGRHSWLDKMLEGG